jgi:hypothetical protein
VYVHSNQPLQTVTVSDDSGRTASYHTDASGYADVYFKAPASAAGETVTVHVGAATCQMTLYAVGTLAHRLPEPTAADPS